MKRYELSAAQWRKIEGFLPGRPSSVGVTGQDNRRFVNGVWRLEECPQTLHPLGQGGDVGRSRGGLSTKIHLVADAQGQPIHFSVTGGQAHDAPQAIPLLTGIKAQWVIADKGYDSNQILNFIQEQGGVAVIPPKANRKAPREYDRELYKQRNLIEQALNKLKHWRRIATRYDRKSIYFLSALYLASAVTWSV
jgi:transposase